MCLSTQRQVSPDFPVGPHHRDGRIYSGMGCLLRGSDHRGSLDRARKTLSHQLLGAPGSISSPKDLSKRQTEAKCPAENGQCDRNCLHQQDGRYPFSSPLRSGGGSLAMVSGERDHNPCRTLARQAKHSSRLGITPCQRLIRLDALEGSFSSSDVDLGAILNRFICCSDKCTATNLLQLAPGPRSTECGCTVNLLEGSSRLHVSSICSDHQMPGENSDGTSHSSPSGPGMAESAVVSTATQEPDRLPDSPAPSSGHPPRPRRSDPPTSASGPSTSTCVANLRRSFLSEGFSDGVITLIRQSWRSSSESAYCSAWHLWDSWCLGLGVDPLSAPLKEILEFLSTQFQLGKQYRTINTIWSVISMTHTDIDGVRVGQHPLVSRLLKGVFNSRPPTPRYSHTWDVNLVLSYRESQPENQVLTFQALTHKVAMLMALSNAVRCSNLAALNLNY